MVFRNILKYPVIFIAILLSLQNTTWCKGTQENWSAAFTFSFETGAYTSTDNLPLVVGVSAEEEIVHKPPLWPTNLDSDVDGDEFLDSSLVTASGDQLIRHTYEYNSSEVVFDWLAKIKTDGAGTLRVTVDFPFFLENYMVRIIDIDTGLISIVIIPESSFGSQAIELGNIPDTVNETNLKIEVAPNPGGIINKSFFTYDSDAQELRGVMCIYYKLAESIPVGNIRVELWKKDGITNKYRCINSANTSAIEENLGVFSIPGDLEDGDYALVADLIDIDNGGDHIDIIMKRVTEFSIQYGENTTDIANDLLAGDLDDSLSISDKGIDVQDLLIFKANKESCFGKSTIDFPDCELLNFSWFADPFDDSLSMDSIDVEDFLIFKRSFGLGTEMDDFDETYVCP